MRVISGARRGAVLFCPEIEGIRPTTDRVKENIFNLIQNDIYGRTVLDLFSGSGAMGIEAISRGAKFCYFNDSGKEAVSAVRQNLKKTGFTEKAQISEKDYLSFLNASGGKFSLVFLDPPYHSGYAGKALDKLLERNMLSDNAVIVAETDGDEEIKEPAGLYIRTQRKYGRVKITVFEKASNLTALI